MQEPLDPRSEAQRSPARDERARRAPETSDTLRRLKVLFVSMEYPPETGGGGIGSYVAVQARALAERGHEVHVLSCVRGQGSRDYLDGDVRVHRRGQPYLRGSERLLRETAWRLHTAAACYREYRRLGLPFDVVEAPDWAAEGFLLALRRPAPLVVHLHSPLVFIYRGNRRELGGDDRFASALERTAIRRADAVCAPSSFIVEELARDGWLPRHDVRVIRHAVDAERWSGAGAASDAPPTILTVGRVEPVKSPEMVVDAVAALASEVPDVSAIFVGRSNYQRDGVPYREWVAGRARDLGVSSTFVDPVPRDALVEWFGRARVAVLPSHHDNLPMAGLEALAAGRPLVCSDRTGLAELIDESGGGRTFAAGDPEGLAAALRPFLVDPQLADEVGRRGRAFVERHCSPAVVTAERERLYAEAMRVARART